MEILDFTTARIKPGFDALVHPGVLKHSARLLQQAPETDLSQKEVYQYSVPTFGKGVVFDVDYSVRQEQFRMFADSLRSSRLRDYVKMMVMEAEVRTWR